MDRRWLLVAVGLTYLIHEAWTLWPDSRAEFRLFPFSEETITVQSYVFAICQHFILVLLFAVIYVLFEEARDVMLWFLAFQVLELIEFFFTYNEPLFHLDLLGFSVGINITNLKAVTMALIVPLKIWKWTLS